MLDGRLLIDAHVHAPRLSTLKPAWRGWAEQFGQPGWADVFADDGTVIPAALDDLMTAEGVDRAWPGNSSSAPTGPGCRASRATPGTWPDWACRAEALAGMLGGNAQRVYRGLAR
jgi:hypothetical protein